MIPAGRAEAGGLSCGEPQAQRPFMKPAGLFYNLLSVEHNVESGGMAHQKTEGNIGTVADPARFELTLCLRRKREMTCTVG